MNNHLRKISRSVGAALVALALFLFFLIFYPVIREELRYRFIATEKILEKGKMERAGGQEKKEKEIVPIDREFGIIIEKIEANAKVMAEVNWKDPKVYQKALTQGVAHAKGTSFPDEAGNVFIFAHSGADFWEANRYNAVFYLLSKLEKDNEIKLYFKQKEYVYQVKEVKKADAKEVNYLGETESDQLTLMTCWPPGTTLKRLIVMADRKN